MFVRNRASGRWVTNTVIDPGELELWDQQISDAIDGAEGGAYAPSNPIEIGGAGLEVGGANLLDFPARIPGIRASFEFLLPLVNVSQDQGASDWKFASGVWTQDTKMQAVFWLPIGPLPIDQTDAALYLKSVTVRIAGGSTPTPDAAPTLAVFRTGAGSMTQLGSTTTDSTISSTPAWQAPHSLTVAVSHQITLNDGGLYARLVGAGWPGENSGTQLISASCAVSGSA